jgi:predicted secreted hydrolase
MEGKEKRCYLASFEGVPKAERNPTNYQRRDDAHHIYTGDEYYEWWYVDCSFDNGYHMVMTFHYRNEFLDPIISTIQLMIYGPDGKKTARYAVCKPEETYAGADWCDVRMGEGNRIRDLGNGRYELSMVIGGIGARLSLRSIVPGWKLGTGFNYKDEETGWVAGWAVPMPHAEAEGELYLKEGTLRVKGVAYHDHNWGNYRFHKTFSAWYWGRVHHGDYAVDYAWVFPRDPEMPVFSPLLIARGREIVLSTNIMHTELGNVVKDPTIGREYARNLSVSTDNLGVKMSLAIDTTRLVETMQLPKSAAWDQYYFRFLADYRMDIEIDGVKDTVRGDLLHEYMVL